MQVTRSAEYALDWPHYQEAKEVFLSQDNYNNIRQVSFFAGYDRKDITQMDSHTVAIFKVTRKVFVNHKGELV